MFTNWKMRLMSLLPMVALLQSCGWSGLRNDSTVNSSALNDPPTITLIEGETYQFCEGSLVGREDHKFHSDYSYRRAIIIGSK